VACARFDVEGDRRGDFEFIVADGAANIAGLVNSGIGVLVSLCERGTGCKHERKSHLV
jgi:hypothetical protein